jgi:hypothetical protein
LPACIAQVESAQGAFAHPVIIGVYKTKDAFAAAGGVGNANAAGRTFLGNVLLSPDLFDNQRERLRAILTHELSHAQIRTWISGAQFTRVPNWFKEGLGVMVSEGGGAENVTDAEAINAIRDGDYISLTTKGSLLHLSEVAVKNSTGEFIPYQTRYKQASLFLEYMKGQSLPIAVKPVF